MQIALRLIILIVFVLTIAVYFIDGYSDFFQILIFILLALTLSYSVNNRNDGDKK